MTAILPATALTPTHQLRRNDRDLIDVIETATSRPVSSNWSDQEDAEAALTLYLH